MLDNIIALWYTPTMKRLLVLLILPFLLLAPNAYATSTPGPTDNTINFAWEHVTQPGDAFIGVCAYGVAWNGFSPSGITYNFSAGDHNYLFLTNNEGDIYVSVDSMPTKPVIATCHNQTAMYPPDPTQVLWLGDIDNNPPVTPPQVPHFSLAQTIPSQTSTSSNQSLPVTQPPTNSSDATSCVAPTLTVDTSLQAGESTLQQPNITVEGSDLQLQSAPDIQ